MLLLSVFSALLASSAAARAPLSTITTYPVVVGQSTINITKEVFTGPSYGGASIQYAFLNLHENENTSVVAVRSYLLRTGGSLVKLSKGNSRTVSFKLSSTTYTFDPNRIFTPEGIVDTLKTYGPYSDAAATETAKFADALLGIYDFDAQSVVMALHNNGGTYGANSYLPGGSYAKDAEKVYIEPGTNPSDFYYVVDPGFYDSLSSQGYNVVLQNNATVTNDGSLSYYAGLRGKQYVNYEAQAETGAWGRQVVIQLDMIYAAAAVASGGKNAK
jgi:hypothetical protein